MDSRKYIQGLYQISAALDEEDPLIEVIKEYEERLPGGLADQKKPSDFNQSQILKGLKIEMEHTDNPMLAVEIAMDHLMEIPNYYDHLEEMEKEAMASNIAEATLDKCRKEDAKPGRPWCIYKHDAPRDSQPKGWPKTYETKEDAKDALQMMHVHGGSMKLTKAEVKMALASLGIEVIDDKIRKSDFIKVFAKEESKKDEKDERPPKKWFDKMYKEIQEGNSGYSDEQIRATIGDIWYHDLSDAKKEEIRSR